MGGLDADLEPVGEAADRSAPPSTWRQEAGFKETDLAALSRCLDTG